MRGEIASMGLSLAAQLEAVRLNGEIAHDPEKMPTL
jgi:hypothetical protein